jgi:hypothetical protein
VLSSLARSPPLVLVVLMGGVIALVALGSLVGLGRSVDVQAILAVHVGWWWLVLAAAVNLVSILAKGAVWKAALESVRAVGRVTWRAVVSAMFVGFLVNTVLAARVGEVARVAVLKRRLRLEGFDVRFTTVAGTVVAEQVVLGLALVLFVGGLALVVPLPGWVGWSLAGVASLLAVAGLALGLAVWSSRRRSGAAARTGASSFTRLVEALMAGQAVRGGRTRSKPRFVGRSGARDLADARRVRHPPRSRGGCPGIRGDDARQPLSGATREHRRFPGRGHGGPRECLRGGSGRRAGVLRRIAARGDGVRSRPWRGVPRR